MSCYDMILLYSTGKMRYGNTLCVFVWYDTIWYTTAPNGMLERNTVCYVKLHLWYGMGMSSQYCNVCYSSVVFFGTVSHEMVWYGTVWYDKVRYHSACFGGAVFCGRIPNAEEFHLLPPMKRFRVPNFRRISLKYPFVHQSILLLNENH